MTTRFIALFMFSVTWYRADLFGLNDVPAELLWQQIIWNSYYQLFDNSINENFRKLVKNLTTMLIDIIIELTNSFIRKIFSSLSIEIQNLYDKFNDWFFFSLFLFFRTVNILHTRRKLNFPKELLPRENLFNNPS